ncbi:MAG: hypothetical protein AAGA60_08575 [Cyanobacteria bacterium P01_E01_bin.42]
MLNTIALILNHFVEHRTRDRDRITLKVKARFLMIGLFCDLIIQFHLNSTEIDTLNQCDRKRN